MKNELVCTDYESMAMMFLSVNFGFVLDASFGKRLTQLEKVNILKIVLEYF